MAANVARLNQQLAAPTVEDRHLTRSLPPLFESLIARIQPDGRLPEGTTISDQMRRQMRDLSERLPAIMADKRAGDETKTLGFLLSAFPRQGISAGVSDMLIEAYCMAMEDCPTWAIEEAARRWITGKCGEKRFAPSPPELRCAADEVVLLARGRASILRQIANAEVVSPPTEEGKERARKFTEIVKTLKKFDDSDDTLLTPKPEEA